MKKMIALLLALALTLSCAAVLAGGRGMIRFRENWEFKIEN